MNNTKIVSALPEVSEKIREEILSSERNELAHKGFMKEIQAMHVLEGNLTRSNKPIATSSKVMSWNMERCLFPEQSAALISKYSPSILLLSEMDCGMARTKQQNTTSMLAELLEMNYLFGLEFFEMGRGSERELDFCDDNFNKFGWHGNAILTSAPIKNATVIRLDDHGHWFCSSANNTDVSQPRVGGRLAIAAIVQTEDKDICVVSTHLESNASVSYREQQMLLLIKEVEKFADGLPILIAGDLNTGNHLPNSDWKLENLFKKAEEKHFTWKYNADSNTTNPSLITRYPEREMKLDWFCTREITADNPKVLSPYTPDSMPLSDHKPIYLEILM